MSKQQKSRYFNTKLLLLQCYIDSINSVKLTILTYYVKIANITSAKTTCTKLDINQGVRG